MTAATPLARYSAMGRGALRERLRYRPELHHHLGHDRATREPEAAEEVLCLSLEAARRQSALSHELNAATSLAALLETQGRQQEALAVLMPVYDRFTEGFETVDLLTARHLLERLGSLVAVRSHRSASHSP
jgi:predicted ATPase